MRYVVLILGLIGTAGTAFPAIIWNTDKSMTPENLALMRVLAEATKDPKAMDGLDIIEARNRTKYALVVAVVLAFARSVVAMNRKGLLAAALLLVAFTLPLALYRRPELVLFTFPLLFAGLLAFFVRSPRPVPAAYAPPAAPAGQY